MGIHCRMVGTFADDQCVYAPIRGLLQRIGRGAGAGEDCPTMGKAALGVRRNYQLGTQWFNQIPNARNQLSRRHVSEA